MKFQKILKYVALFLFILPFILNQIWYVGGDEWMYWISRSLCYSEIIVFGLLLLVFSRKPRIKNGSQEKSPFMKIVLFVYGIILVVIGIFLFIMIIGRLFQGCQPLSCV